MAHSRKLSDFTVLVIIVYLSIYFIQSANTTKSRHDIKLRLTEQPGNTENTQEHYRQEVQCPLLSRPLQSIEQKNTRINQNQLKGIGPIFQNLVLYFI